MPIAAEGGVCGRRIRRPARHLFAAAKIVKGECHGKSKTKFSDLTWPSRILSYEKITKGERHGKSKTKFSDLTWPSRILSYEKIVKGERHGKSKTEFSESKLPAGISVTAPSNSTKTPPFYESKDRKNESKDRKN